MVDDDDFLDLATRVSRIERVLETILPILEEIIKERKPDN